MTTTNTSYVTTEPRGPPAPEPEKNTDSTTITPSPGMLHTRTAKLPPSKPSVTADRPTAAFPPTKPFETLVKNIPR